MKRGQPAPAPAVDECPQCTTPNKCGRTGNGKRGPRCVGRADGLDDCDCLNRCGDDPWLDNGKAKPCARRASEEAAALHRATAGPIEYASWFPIVPGTLPAGHKVVPLEAPESLCGLLTGYGSDLSYMTERDRKIIIERGRDYWTDLLASLPHGVAPVDVPQPVARVTIRTDMKNDDFRWTEYGTTLDLSPGDHDLYLSPKDGVPGTFNDQQGGA